MEFVTNIPENEYENFVINHKKSHFMQSYYFGQIKSEKGFIPYYVGIKENNKLICTALLLYKKLIGKYGYFYSPRGPLLDYNNKEMIKTFTKYLKEFSKKNHCLFIRIDPDVEFKNNQELLSNLKKLGYKHKGFNTGFENEQPRFTFRLNLRQELDELHNNIHPTTRNILNRDNPYNLNIYIGNNNDIKDFYTTMIETGKRNGLLQSPLEYYETFYSIFNEHNMSDLYVVKVDLNNLKEIYSNKLKTLNDEKENIKSKNTNPKKMNNMIQELDNQINKVKQDIEMVSDINEEEITLSSMITVKYGNKVWTVHGGNNSLLMNLNANYLLYYTIIKDSVNKYDLIDFFGTTGIKDPDPKNPIFGIHFFKKRFGGNLCEFIGEFDLITNKFMYTLYINLLPIYRKIKK